MPTSSRCSTRRVRRWSLSFPDYVLTTIPSLHGEYVHGDKLAATGILENGAVTFNFKAETGGLAKEYVLSFPGYRPYTPGANDETEEIKFDGNRPGGSDWTNGIYTISAVNDGYQSWFKGGKGEHQLSIPANYVVKQLIFRDLKNNYAGNIARITDVKSEGATVIAPTLSGFQHENVKLVNLVYNFENHVAGTPVSFTFDGGGQMMWSFELTVEKQALTGAPTLESIEIVAPEGTNHFVAIAKYDRVIKKAKASVDTITVNGTAGAPTVYFPVTDLDYSTKYTLTIAAGDVEDEYGNKTTEAVSKDIEIGAKATVAKTLPVVVSTVDEAPFSRRKHQRQGCACAQRRLRPRSRGPRHPWRRLLRGRPEQGRRGHPWQTERNLQPCLLHPQQHRHISAGHNSPQRL